MRHYPQESLQQIKLNKLREFLLRKYSGGVLAEVIVEDLIARKTVQESSPLCLLDAYVEDYISTDQDGLWSTSSRYNFGYDYTQPEFLDEVLTRRHFIPELLDIIVNHLDALADEIDKCQPILAGQYKNGETNEHLEKLHLIYSIWQAQRDNHDNISQFARVSFIRQRDDAIEEKTISLEYSLVWYIEHALIQDFLKVNQNQQLADKVKPYLSFQTTVEEAYFPIDILKILYTDRINADPHFSNLPDSEIQDEINHQINEDFNKIYNALLSFVGKLIKSRQEIIKDFVLTFGIGIYGDFFEPESQRIGDNNTIYLNFSNKYRETYHLIFLELLRDVLSVTLNNNFKKIAITVNVLATVNKEDEIAHSHILWKAIEKVYISPDEVAAETRNQLRSGMVERAKNKREEINNKLRVINIKIQDAEKVVSNKEKILKNEKTNKKKIERTKKELPEAKKRLEKLKNENASAIEELTNKQNALTEIIEVMHGLSEQAIKELHILFKEGMRSVCVEPAISTHSHENGYISVTFRNNKGDRLSLNGGELVSFGKHQRGIIPPCSEFCQLYALAHMLWAELTGKQSLDKLNQQAQRQGKEAVFDMSSLIEQFLPQAFEEIAQKVQLAFNNLPNFPRPSDVGSHTSSSNSPITTIPNQALSEEMQKVTLDENNNDTEEPSVALRVFQEEEAKKFGKPTVQSKFFASVEDGSFIQDDVEDILQESDTDEEEKGEAIEQKLEYSPRGPS